ncbi:plasmid mobilization relaxosome protein MobC [Algoriphagus sp. D3-2-R+10]|uniref:plasmid mobilization protein n=1 Tax=Algoriphagus aurantiacus TaxID=3103948 RepID=UPI002B3EB4F9|nr:plasmid mobilization relaxosome protein MobC [Algoriphagus sp. D3-2-R+10]MEB2776488.1 plasmid mobilization relaxosome protein MobC [Algoriphagus sp. D3-2-R+10]
MKEDNNRSKWLHVRLTHQEYDQIQTAFGQTVQDSLSDYARKLLLKKPVIGRYKDTGMQELLAELTFLRRDLHGIATNYNQLVKKINSSAGNEVEVHLSHRKNLQQEIEVSLESVNRFINQTAEKWLQS